MKHVWHAMTVAALVAALGSNALAQPEGAPGGEAGQGKKGNSLGNGGTPPGQAKKGLDTGEGTAWVPPGQLRIQEEAPSQQNPDPFGLTLALSGSAAAAAYVIRRKRLIS